MKKIMALTFVVLLVACNGEAPIKTMSISVEPELTTKIESVIKEQKEIQKASIIGVNDEWLIAVQIKPWLKLEKKKLEEQLQEKLAKLITKEQLLYSSDFKLFYESEKLINESLDAQQLKKKMEALKKLMKEET